MRQVGERSAKRSAARSGTDGKYASMHQPIAHFAIARKASDEVAVAGLVAACLNRTISRTCTTISASGIPRRRSATTRPFTEYRRSLMKVSRVGSSGERTLS